MVFNLLQADEFIEFAFGLRQQHALALLSSGVDEIAGTGLGVGVPWIGASVDPVRGGGDDPETGVGQGLLDLFVLGVGGVQILQNLARRLLVDVRAQHKPLGQRAVDRRDGDGTVGLLEVGQCRGEHAQPGQRGAQGDLGRVREGLVEIRVVDDRRQQLDDVRPPLGAIVDDDGDPARLTPARPGLDQAGDDLVGLGVSPRCGQRRGVRELKIVRGGGTKLQVQPGVVAEAQGAGRQFHLPRQHPGGGRGTRNGLEHPEGCIAGGGQPGPGVALIVGHAGQRGETGARGGQVGRSLALVDRDTQRAATCSKPADNVAIDPAVHPRIHGPSREHAGITAFHGSFVSRT